MKSEIKEQLDYLIAQLEMYTTIRRLTNGRGHFDNLYIINNWNDNNTDYSRYFYKKVDGEPRYWSIYGEIYYTTKELNDWCDVKVQDIKNDIKDLLKTI